MHLRWPTKAMAPVLCLKALIKKVILIRFQHQEPITGIAWTTTPAPLTTLGTKNLTPGWLRSVGQVGFWGLESFIDEVAVATNQDPVFVLPC